MCRTQFPARKDVFLSTTISTRKVYIHHPFVLRSLSSSILYLASMLGVCVLFALVVALRLGNARLMFMELGVANASFLSHQLDNHHLVMVGDSLTRYQYLSLVYLAHTGRFYDAIAGTKNLVADKTFKDWDDFFTTSNEMFAPNEYCDCNRNYSLDASSHMYENRYYYNRVRNLSISYMQYFGDDRTLRGHWQPSDKDSNHQKHGPDREFVPFRWEYAHVEDAIANIAAKLQPKPSVLVLNAGLWPNKFNNPSHRDRVLNRTISLFDRVIWKTTTHKRDRAMLGYDEHCFDDNRVECLDLVWTKFLSPGDYCDNKHFQAPIYNDINIQLIHLLTTEQALSVAPLSDEHRNKVVIVKDKQYLVDVQGILRHIPVGGTLSIACAHDLAARVQVHAHAHTLTNNILGSALSPNCTL